MNLLRRDPRGGNALATPTLEPFGLVRNLLRWDPFREQDLNIDFQPGFLPSFDIQETPEAYLFEGDIPGISKDDLDINLVGNRLTIAGKREAKSRKEGDTYFTMERSFGAFTRSFTLPEGVDGGKVQADLKDGVLMITIPKVPEVQPKKISVSLRSS
jgi:HSP20 family protein